MNIFDDFPFQLEKDEELKQIKEYPDYWISNYGKVFSYKTNARSRKGWHILASTIHNNYKDCKISMRGRTSHLQIHRYVALYFCKGYKKGLVVNHIDGNSANNHYKNLEWITQKENMHKGYITSGMSATRNFNYITLISPNNEELGAFIGFKNLGNFIV